MISHTETTDWYVIDCTISPSKYIAHGTPPSWSLIIISTTNLIISSLFIDKIIIIILHKSTHCAISVCATIIYRIIRHAIQHPFYWRYYWQVHTATAAFIRHITLSSCARSYCAARDHNGDIIIPDLHYHHKSSLTITVSCRSTLTLSSWRTLSSYHYHISLKILALRYRYPIIARGDHHHHHRSQSYHIVTRRYNYSAILSLIITVCTESSYHHHCAITIDRSVNPYRAAATLSYHYHMRVIRYHH